MTVDRVLLAAPRGFCAGVEMAIKALAWMVRAFDPPVYCYHEIVHNQLVVKRFEDLGVIFVDNIADVPAGRDAGARPVVEGGTVLGAQAVEGVVLEQLALDAAGRGRAPAVAHQQDQLAPGDAAQQPFDQRRPDEPRRPRDGDPCARQRLGDHGAML